MNESVKAELDTYMIHELAGETNEEHEDFEESCKVKKNVLLKAGKRKKGGSPDLISVKLKVKARRDKLFHKSK